MSYFHQKASYEMNIHGCFFLQYNTIYTYCIYFFKQFSTKFTQNTTSVYDTNKCLIWLHSHTKFSMIQISKGILICKIFFFFRHRLQKTKQKQKQKNKNKKKRKDRKYKQKNQHRGSRKRTDQQKNQRRGSKKKKTDQQTNRQKKKQKKDRPTD